MKSLRVLIVDDHALFRDAITNLLRAVKMRVVGHADNGDEAIALVRTSKPGLVLMDISMNGIDGIAAMRAIKDEHEDVKVVMLTMSDDDENIFEALRQGADGYILKTIAGDHFCEQLKRVANGEPALSPEVASKLLRKIRATVPKHNSADVTIANLSRREVEILGLVARGLTNLEIADTLSLSESTVKFHVSNLLSKLHLRNRAEATNFAARAGLITDDFPRMQLSEKRPDK